MKNKILNYISFLILFVAFGGMLILGYWAFYPYKTTEYNTEKFRILTKEVSPGEKVVYEVDACKYLDKKPKVSVVFVNDIRYLSSDNFAAISLGCHKTLVERIVPDTLPSSHYHLEITIEYEINPIRTITNSIESEEFEVVSN